MSDSMFSKPSVTNTPVSLITPQKGSSKIVSSSLNYVDATPTSSSSSNTLKRKTPEQTPTSNEIDYVHAAQEGKAGNSIGDKIEIKEGAKAIDPRILDLIGDQDPNAENPNADEDSGEDVDISMSDFNWVNEEDEVEDEYIQDKLYTDLEYDIVYILGQAEGVIDIV